MWLITRIADWLDRWIENLFGLQPPDSPKTCTICKRPILGEVAESDPICLSCKEELDRHPANTARYDRGNGCCFRCYNSLTAADRGPDGECQLCLNCQAELKATEEKLTAEARQFGRELTASLDRIGKARAKALIDQL